MPADLRKSIVRPYGHFVDTTHRPTRDKNLFMQTQPNLSMPLQPSMVGTIGGPVRRISNAYPIPIHTPRHVLISPVSTPVRTLSPPYGRMSPPSGTRFFSPPARILTRYNSKLRLGFVGIDRLRRFQVACLDDYTPAQRSKRG